MRWSLWRVPFRLAWRDVRGSRSRTAFIVAAMAISVASVSGVYGGAASIRRSLGRDSKIWLGGDLAAETTEPVSEKQMAALDHMPGVAWTQITWTLTTASSDQAADPVLIGIKAIDPRVYPFYGAITLTPRTGSLGPGDIAVSKLVLERLHVAVGDSIRVAGRPFRISGMIGAEPERFSGIFNWGPRGILSRAAFAKITAPAAGNSLTQRVLLRLGPGSNPAGLRRRLEDLFPDAHVFDYREAAAPEVARMELVISFVSIAAFLALALGSVGVATAVRLNLEQRMETLAMLRVNGARSSQMAWIFASETMAMLAGGLALGLPLGWAMKGSLLSLLEKYLVLPQSAIWDRPPILESALAAAAIMAPVLAAPAASLRRWSPMAVLRRDASSSAPVGSGRWPAGAAAIAVAALAALSREMVQEWTPALFLVMALAAAAALAWMATLVALSILRRGAPLTRHSPTLKHAILGLCRRGNRSAIPMVCVALGLMMIIASFGASRAVLETVSDALPYSGANLVVTGFDADHRAAVRGFLKSQPGVESVDSLTQTWMRFARVDGVEKDDARYLGECSEDVHGVVLADDLAARLGARLGSELDFETSGGTVRETLAAIRHPSAQERFWFTFLVNCRDVPESARIETAAAQVRAGDVQNLLRAVNARFPALAVISSEEIEATLAGIIGDAMTIVRAITWAGASGGLLILIAVVAASRAARSRETAIFLALGARRRTMFRIYSLEFALMGIVAGSIASVLGCGLSSVLIGVLFHRAGLAFPWRVMAAAVAIAPLLVWTAGWLPAFRLLQLKPLAILRRE